MCENKLTNFFFKTFLKKEKKKKTLKKDSYLIQIEIFLVKI